MRKALYVIPLLLLAVSCRSTRVNSSRIENISHSNSNVANYTSLYAQKAVQEMQRTGIPASITLAQGIIESDYGRSRLATRANNHFGIKCHSSWKGKKIYHDDDKRGECFRSYNSAEESFRDHSDFLVNGSRYDFLFSLRLDDYKGWAKGLKKAGYATNPKYASMLIRTIEENKLFLYDNSSARVMAAAERDNNISSGKEPVISDNAMADRSANAEFVVHNRSRIKTRNRIQYILVEENDTYRSLAKEFDLLSWEIFRYNDLPDEAELRRGQLLFLQPKRNKAEIGNDYHILKEGETMFTISQLYGIKLKILYERNNLVPGRKPETGTELWLRKAKPEGL